MLDEKDRARVIGPGAAVSVLAAFAASRTQCRTIA
jgi:hypothetical protein